MTDSLLELDAIARNYRQTQTSSLTSFRTLHSAVSDISRRSGKIREATRSHLRALNNVTRTEKELNAAISSYTIPDWLIRVGETCSKRPKGDAAVTTSELCRAMQRLVVSKAYLDSKPWNPVAENLGGTVDRFVKNIVAAAEDRVLLKFMSAAVHGQQSSSSSSSPGVNANSAATAAAGGGGGSKRNNNNKQQASSEGIIFGDVSPPDMHEASELLSALFKNYSRPKAALEVKSYILDLVHETLETKRSEYRRLRFESSSSSSSSSSSFSSGGGGASSLLGNTRDNTARSLLGALLLSSSDSSSFLKQKQQSSAALSFFGFGSSASLDGPERLSSALRELVVNFESKLAEEQSSKNAKKKTNSKNKKKRRGKRGGHNDDDNNLQVADDPECILGVSRCARDLCLDISKFLEKYILHSVPEAPKRKTATEVLLQGSAAKHDHNHQQQTGAADHQKFVTSSGLLVAPSMKQQHQQNEEGGTNNNIQQQLLQQERERKEHQDHTTAPLEADAADEIDELRGIVLALPSEIVDFTACFALDLIVKLVSDMRVRAIFALHETPVVLLEAVQEAWNWRHTVRQVCGDTTDLIENIDYKVDEVMSGVFDCLANLRDEPGNLSKQSFLDLALMQSGAESSRATFADMPPEINFITGVRSLGDVFGSRKIFDQKIDAAFRRKSWHPERDHFFAFSPLLVDALRRIVSVHEATLHVVFAGSTGSLDRLIQRADSEITVRHARAMKEARRKSSAYSSSSSSSSSSSFSLAGAAASSSSAFSAGVTATSAATAAAGGGGGGGGGFHRQQKSTNFQELSRQLFDEISETVGREMFEQVRYDVEDFFVRTMQNHLQWVNSVAGAAFLLHHGEFEVDDITEEQTRFCMDTEDDLLWSVPAGKLRFHPAVFRANTLQKIITRLSSPGVFDVEGDKQLLWGSRKSNHQQQQQQFHHRSTSSNNSNNNNNNNPASSLASKDALAMFGVSASPTSASSSSSSSSSTLPPPQQQQDYYSPQPRVPLASLSTSSLGSASSTSPSWRHQLLSSLVEICSDQLEQEVELIGSRFATILPPLGDDMAEIAEIDASTPLTKNQRMLCKNWYEKSTSALAAELELWETGVIVVEDAGLRMSIGESSYKAVAAVFQQMKEMVLKDRQWSTRCEKWYKFPITDLEKAIRGFRVPNKED